MFLKIIIPVCLGSLFSIAGFADTVKSLLSIVEDEEIVKENKIKIDELEKKQSGPETKICLYMNGATVNILLPGSSVRSDNHFTIHNLSNAIYEKSIIVRCPDTVFLEEYKMVNAPADPKKNNPEKEKSPAEEKVLPQSLELSVHNQGKINPDDLWSIQYSVKKICWHANHIIEFTNDREHITFETIIQVSNQSGIDFKNAKIQFLDCDLPDENAPKKTFGEEQSTSYSPPSLVYQSTSPRDILTHQEKTIVWSSAKRIAIATSNGLFVGGKYLNKMNEIAYPQIENWITFPNTKEVGLGQALPGGKVSVYYNNENYVSLIGFTTMNQVRDRGDVTIRMPSFSQYQSDTKNNEFYSSLTAYLTQESFRILTPTMSEARYKLSLQNLQNYPVSLMVTVDFDESKKCLITRENMKSKKNKDGEPVWTIEIPPKGSKEIRYELTIKTRT